LYPCPDVAITSLGTHLTKDMGGNVRFGPDTEWLEAPIDPDSGEDVEDFWRQRLAASESHLEGAFESVRRYLPGVKRDGFSPDCKIHLPNVRLDS
jgi:2-hydroxyglutarate dehydrogenase